MAYTPPAGDQILLAFAGSYSPPAGDQIALAIDALAETPPFMFGGLAHTVRAAWNQGDARAAVVQAPWSQSGLVDRAQRLAWGFGDGRDHHLSMAWQASQLQDHAFADRWDWTESHDRSVAARWRDAPPADSTAGIAWDWGAPLAVSHRLRWSDARRHGQSTAARWGQAEPHERSWSLLWRDAAPHSSRWQAPWDWATPALQRYHVDPPPVPVVPRPSCYTPPPGDSVPLAFRGDYTPPPGDQLRFDLVCGDVPRIYHLTRTRIVEHTVTVCRLPDRLPLHCLSATIQADIDSWSQAIDLQLADRASYHAILPDADGPKLVEINASGHVYVALIERVSERRVAPLDARATPTRFSASGRSRTALLATPYAPARPYVSEAAMTAQQAVIRELEFTPFSLDWQIDDWLIPAGAWRYDNETPMSAILRIAAAAGAVVQSHPADETIIVRPAYPAAPWAWSGESPAVILDGGSLIEMGREWQPGPQYLGVYVSGDTQGVLVNVLRAGSGGSPCAQMIVDPLITAVEPARGRGLRAIADSHNQTLEPIVLPLLPAPAAPGVIDPAMLVQVEDPVHGIYKALSKSVTISVGLSGDAVTIRQTVELARHYPVDLT